MSEARRGALPVVLSGNCIAAVGTLAGIGAKTGIVWFDAHGDFNTAATTPTGYVDGMALAVATGREWQRVAGGVLDFRPADPGDAVHVGGRDFDPGERESLAEAGVALVPPDRIDLLPAVLERLASRVDAVYLHLDVDVLDSAEGRANAYASRGGLRRSELLTAVVACLQILPVAAAGIAAYDPSFDPDGRIATIAAEAVSALPSG